MRIVKVEAKFQEIFFEEILNKELTKLQNSAPCVYIMNVRTIFDADFFRAFILYNNKPYEQK